MIAQPNHRATRAAISPMRHHAACRGHFWCPACRRRVCGTPTVVGRDGSPRRVACLECGEVYRARAAIH